MNAERWGRVKEIFDQTVDLPPEEQRSVVRTSCSDDPTLETEVLRLLDANRSAGDFLETAAANLHSHLAGGSLLPGLMPGTVLMRRFEIRRFINSGGMGEVYEAWDLDLHQPIALKTILPRVAAHPEIIDRFKREVRHARSVSHPNICRVHELFCHEDEHGDRTWFLSMELLSGPTLREHIRNDGPLPFSTGRQVAEQLLLGMEAAHTRGLVHRDFKSSNVILLPGEDGETRAVITDFGLSLRVLPGEARNDEPAGMGTPGYMAPEQQTSGHVGPLADQFALGVVLHEMMTGQLPDRQPSGEAQPQTATVRGYPSRWNAVLRRCMQTQPRDRFADIADVRSALGTSAWQRSRRWVLASFALLITCGLAFMLRRPASSAPLPGCTICDVVQDTPDTDESESPALSRDGRFLAYSSDRGESGNLDIFVQQLPTGRLTRVTSAHARDGDPSLSADGKLVVFRSERGGGGVYMANTDAPSEQKLLVSGGRNPQLSPDGRDLLYWTGDASSNVHSGKIFRMPVSGGKATQIAAGFADARYPQWSPDGSAILFTGCSSADELPPGCFDWWASRTRDGALVNTHGLATLRTAGLVPGRLNAAAWWDGNIVFSAIGTKNRLNLASIPINSDTLQTSGTPRWLLPEQTGDVDPALSRDGEIAFTRTAGALHIWRLQHALAGRKAVAEKVTDDADVDGSPFVSEGGRYVVYARGRTTRRQIMLRSVDTGQDETLINAGTPVQTPIIDRAGKWLAYQQTEPDGSSAIYAGMRGGAMKKMCRNCTEPSGWFGGDEAFFYRDGAHASIGLLDPRTGLQHIILQEPRATLSDASWSAASGALLFVESVGDRKRMFSVSMHDTTPKAQSTWHPIAEPDGVPLHPRWSGDGKTVFYLSNADGFQCIYGRPVLASSQLGPRFAVDHFHHQRASIDNVLPRVFNLSVDGDTLYFNLGEQSSSIQVGQLHR